MGRFDGCCPSRWHLVTSNTFTVNNGCQLECTEVEAGFDRYLIKNILWLGSAGTEINTEAKVLAERVILCVKFASF